MSSEFEKLAEEVGAKDIFVFHLLSDDRMVNLDGWGRGSGWAGNVCLDPDTEQFLGTALRTGSARTGPGSPNRIFGPYWAEEASAVRLDGHVVALGGVGMASLSSESVMAIASRALDHVSGNKANKQLADMLEVTQAELSVASIDSSTMHDTASQLAMVAARALSCEFGAVVILGAPPTVAIADHGWRPAATDDEVLAALLPLLGALDDGVFVEQDLRLSPYGLPPMSFTDGLVSRCSVPFVFQEQSGMLTVAHSGSAPRGFTDLCRSVASRMVEAAAVPLSRQLS